MVTFYIDPNSGVTVIRDPNGSFLSGWQLNPQQLGLDPTVVSPAVTWDFCLLHLSIPLSFKGKDRRKNGSLGLAEFGMACMKPIQIHTSPIEPKS